MAFWLSIVDEGAEVNTSYYNLKSNLFQPIFIRLIGGLSCKFGNQANYLW